MVPLNYYLILGAILFVIGCVGVLTRRNAIVILLSIEIILNGVNLTLIAFSHFLNNVTGQILVIFVITVAAAEAGVGLGIIIALYRNKTTINVDEFNLLKW
jgi:NADH-quinone oxidoreductase subunit K